MQSNKISSYDLFSLRTIGEIDDHTIAMCEHAITTTFEKLNITSGHLFITLLAGSCIRIDEYDEGGIGLYETGLQAISIACTKPPQVSKEIFVREIRLTISHEIAHWQQDIQGILGDDASEAIAESLALAVWDK